MEVRHTVRTRLRFGEKKRSCQMRAQSRPLGAVQCPLPKGNPKASVDPCHTPTNETSSRRDILMSLDPSSNEIRTQAKSRDWRYQLSDFTVAIARSYRGHVANLPY
jgi:hypothetical protein